MISKIFNPELMAQTLGQTTGATLGAENGLGADFFGMLLQSFQSDGAQAQDVLNPTQKDKKEEFFSVFANSLIAPALENKPTNDFVSIDKTTKPFPSLTEVPGDKALIEKGFEGFDSFSQVQEEKTDSGFELEGFDVRDTDENLNIDLSNLKKLEAKPLSMQNAEKTEKPEFAIPLNKFSEPKFSSDLSKDIQNVGAKEVALKKESTGKDPVKSSDSPDAFFLSQLQQVQLMEAIAPQKAPRVETVPMDQLESKISSMVGQGGGQVKFVLNPPELGHIEVQVSTKGKKVELKILSATETGKVALESRMFELKSTLESQNLNLEKADVQLASQFHFSDSHQMHKQAFGGFDGREQQALRQEFKSERFVAPANLALESSPRGTYNPWENQNSRLNRLV